MILKFLGGASEVGRSAFLLKGRQSILLDYGIKLNHGVEYPEHAEPDLLLLSHAHIDHSGYVPTLYNEGNVPAICTEATAALSELLLNDSIKVARKEHLPQRFHKRQVASFLHRYTGVEYNSETQFGDFAVSMHDAGHICGSAITLMEGFGGNCDRIVYTGDFKLGGQMMHAGAEVVKGDVLITESTYATREHPERDSTMEKLVENVKSVLDTHGNVLLPVFAVGRSQELLALMKKHNLAQYVYLDGMARAATGIVMKHKKDIRNSQLLDGALRDCTVVEGREDREEALSMPSIIMTTAGMLSGGPVLDYISRLRKNSEILITGYQVEGSNGRMLMDSNCVVIDGEKRRIANPVRHYDLSAHAGKEELHEYAKRCGPRKIICVHGDEGNAAQLAEDFKLEGFDAYAPKINDEIDLSA